MPPTGNAAKNWCFTHNNYTDDDVARYSTLADTNARVQYLLAGKEVGENGTPHLQGFVSFGTRLRMAQVKTALGSPTVHVEVCRSVPASIEYCKKEGDFFESGRAPGGAGRRSDLDEFKDAVKGGLYSLSEIRETHSEVYAKYTRFCLEYIQDHLPPQQIAAHELYPWQQDLNQRLIHAPDDRSVVFVVDVTGNNGKTWFAYYFASLHDGVQVLQPGKKADMAYALDPTIRVLFLDAPRSKQGEYLQYDFLEYVKNGHVFSGKYESRVKKLGKCHVVVLMNEMPDMSKLSADRYVIIEI